MSHHFTRKISYGVSECNTDVVVSKCYCLGILRLYQLKVDSPAWKTIPCRLRTPDQGGTNGKFWHVQIFPWFSQTQSRVNSGRRFTTDLKEYAWSKQTCLWLRPKDHGCNTELVCNISFLFFCLEITPWHLYTRHHVFIYIREIKIKYNNITFAILYLINP